MRSGALLAVFLASSAGMIAGCGVEKPRTQCTPGEGLQCHLMEVAGKHEIDSLAELEVSLCNPSGKEIWCGWHQNWLQHVQLLVQLPTGRDTTITHPESELQINALLGPEVVKPGGLVVVARDRLEGFVGRPNLIVFRQPGRYTIRARMWYFYGNLVRNPDTGRDAFIVDHRDTLVSSPLIMTVGQ